MFTEEQIQKDKEDLMRLAASRNLGIHRLGKDIFAVNKEGEFFKVSSSDSWESLWHSGKQAFEEQMDLPKLTAKDVEKLKAESTRTERDRLRFEAINLAIKEHGFALFHRGNQLIGINSVGEEKVIALVDEDIKDTDRPSDEIWRIGLDTLRNSGLEKK